MNKTENKKRKIKRAICAILVLLIIGTLSYTYAKYIASDKASGSAEIANWSFKITKDAEEQVKTIKLANTTTKSTLIDGKIAPGTAGEFTIELDATGSEVGVDYGVIFTNEQNTPSNIIFNYNNKNYKTLSQIEEIKGSIGINDEKTKTILIKWNWPYETGLSKEIISENDRIDTQEGKANLDYTFDVIVTGTQSE